MFLVQQLKSEESGGDHLHIGKSPPNWGLAGFKSVSFSNEYKLWDRYVLQRSPPMWGRGEMKRKNTHHRVLPTSHCS